jgi:hypothetical protein
MWIPSHVGIIGNENADEMAKSAENAQISQDYLTTVSDVKCQLKELAKAKWKQSWNDDDNIHNKYRQIKQDITDWQDLKTLTREESIKITRLRLGHTRYTHEHLLKRENPQLCTCGSTATVKHIMEECTQTTQERQNNNIIGIETLKKHDHDTLAKIIEYLKDIGIYDRI